MQMNQIQLQNYTSSGQQISLEERKKWYKVAHSTWMVASWVWTIIVTCLVGFTINSLTTIPEEKNPLARTIIGALQAREPIAHIQWSAIILIVMLLALIVTLLAFLAQQQLKPALNAEFQGVIDMAGQDNILTELQHIRRLLEQTINATQIQHREQVVVQRTTTQALNTIHQILQRLYQKSLEPVRIQVDQFTTLTNQERVLTALQHLEELIEDAQTSYTQESVEQRQQEEPVEQIKAEQEDVVAHSDQSIPQETQEAQEIQENQEMQPTQPLTVLAEVGTDLSELPREGQEEGEEDQDVEPTQPMAKLAEEHVE
jgi:hypothetical protein